MPIQNRSKPVWIAAALGLASLALAVPGVQAAKPIVTTRPPVTTTLEAGTACPFEVTDTELPGSTFKTTVFSDGRSQEKRKGQEQFTNVATGESVIVKLAATVTSEVRDGILFFKSTGIAVGRFFPGDQGPFGTVGEDGALFHVTGHAEGVVDLSTENGIGIFFSLSGRATDICGLIS
jgi:hypothetical protein